MVHTLHCAILLGCVWGQCVTSCLNTNIPSTSVAARRFVLMYITTSYVTARPHHGSCIHPQILPATAATRRCSSSLDAHASIGYARSPQLTSPAPQRTQQRFHCGTVTAHFTTQLCAALLTIHANHCTQAVPFGRWYWWMKSCRNPSIATSEMYIRGPPVAV
jgi:hypothetical protein